MPAAELIADLTSTHRRASHSNLPGYKERGIGTLPMSLLRVAEVPLLELISGTVSLWIDLWIDSSVCICCNDGHGVTGAAGATWLVPYPIYLQPL